VRTAFVSRLQLVDFRCFAGLDVSFGPHVTVLSGANGQGKTSLLEAIAWAARGRSFRGVPDRVLVRAGAPHAVVRCRVVSGTREQELDAELRVGGRNRVLLNRNPVVRQRDLHGFLRVTVFSPDDLQLVKGGPTERRTYLDELLSVLAPRYDASRVDYERVLRQRNALLRGGVRDAEARATLDVFDEQLARVGGEVVQGRLRLAARLAPAVAGSCEHLAARPVALEARYEAEWSPEPLDGCDAAGAADRLRSALQAGRRAETDRGVTLVGPHRDDWRLVVDGLDARTQSSQGEQRTLALAMRLAGHGLGADLTGTTPVLLLDDVFSELDPGRAAALLEHVPRGQTLVTTTGPLPEGLVADERFTVQHGRVEVAR
jgi:DNA replication and repair protein RecF